MGGVGIIVAIVFVLFTLGVAIDIGRDLERERHREEHVGLSRPKQEQVEQSGEKQ